MGYPPIPNSLCVNLPSRLLVAVSPIFKFLTWVLILAIFDFYIDVINENTRFIKVGVSNVIFIY